MPTTYAHDLFGRAVMHHLSGQTAQVVKEYPAAYRAGLQGTGYFVLLCAVSKK